MVGARGEVRAEGAGTGLGLGFAFGGIVPPARGQM